MWSSPLFDLFFGKRKAEIKLEKTRKIFESDLKKKKKTSLYKKMSAKNTAQVDAKREEFRKYLEKSGVLETLTKSLVSLYEEPSKPTDALGYMRNNFTGTDIALIQTQMDNIKQENDELQKQVRNLEAEKAALLAKVEKLEKAATEKSETSHVATETDKVDKAPHHEEVEEKKEAESSPIVEAKEEDKVEEKKEEEKEQEVAAMETEDAELPPPPAAAEKEKEPEVKPTEA